MVNSKTFVEVTLHESTTNQNSIDMKSYIFQINENVLPSKNESIYVLCSEHALRERMYVGGFLRFLASFYDYPENYPIDGQKVLTLKEFDVWRKDHHCC